MLHEGPGPGRDAGMQAIYSSRGSLSCTDDATLLVFPEYARYVSLEKHSNAS